MARLFLLVWVAGLWAGAAVAQAAQPLPVRNDNPALRLLGVPRTVAAQALPAGTRGLALRVSTSNHFTSAVAAAEVVRFDGETTVVELVWQQPLANRWQLALTLPWVSHHGGRLDGFIDRFHDNFGFGALGRDGVRRHQLDLTVVQPGQRPIRITDSRRGPGDLAVQLARPLAMPWQGWQARVWAQLELPTGAPGQLLGSGSVDASAGVSAAAPAGRWGTLYGGLGGLAMTSARHLDNQHGALLGHLGWASPAWRGWQAQVQVDANTPLVDSRTSQLGRSVAVLGLGVAWQVSPATRVTGLVTEDLIGRSSPDVGFQLGISHNW